MNSDKADHFNVIDRSLLLKRLDSALAFRLTLLTAPPTSGRSALLREWIDSLDHRRALVTLDARDNEPEIFLSDLIAALQGVEPAIAQALQVIKQQSINDSVVDLINELTTVPEDFILALDNYHLIDAPAVHQLVEMLLEYPPPQMHLVIATHTTPPLPLPRLRVRRQLLTLELVDRA